MRKGFPAVLLAVSSVLGVVCAASAQDRERQAGLLGETLIRIMLGSSKGVYIGVDYGEGFDVKKDLARFRAQLKAGADPSLVRIAGFAPSQVQDGVASMGQIGGVVSAERGGLTLFEFAKMNGLGAICAILKEHERRRTVATPAGPGGQRKPVYSESLIAAIDFSIVGRWFYIYGPWSLQASPDLRHVHYQADSERGHFFVVDGKPEKQYVNLYFGHYSPDGQHLAYGAYNYTEYFVTLDGKESKPYANVDGITFSRDSRRLMYRAKSGQQQVAVVDGKEGKAYDEIGGMDFSPDSKHVAYAARTGDRWFVVVDENEGDSYDQIAAETPVFAPDSQHVLFGAKAGANWQVITSESRQQLSSEIRGKLTFSPDGRHFAYSTKAGESWKLVLDGTPQRPYELITEVTFSPDSAHLAYWAKSGGKQLVVLDGNEGKPYDDSLRFAPVFSPDSKHLAYRAKLGNKSLIVLDGNEGKPYDDVQYTGPVFSSDSQHHAYKAEAGGKAFVVADGREGTAYDDVETPAFSPDNKHLAYQAKSEYAWFSVIDGKEGRPYDSSLDFERHIIFDTPSTLRYLAMKDDSIYAIEERIPESRGAERTRGTAPVRRGPAKPGPKDHPRTNMN